MSGPVMDDPVDRIFEHTHLLMENADKQQCFVHVDGNIGAGKTTLCKQLKVRFQQEGYLVFYEEEHINLKYLYMFNSDKHRYALGFQMYQLTQCQKAFEVAVQWLKYMANPDDRRAVVIIDRSLLGNHAFARVHHTIQPDEDDVRFRDIPRRRNITDEELKLYEDTLEQYINTNAFTQYQHLLMYVDTNVEKCQERISKRDRLNEKDTIPQSYLQKIQDQHLVVLEQQEFATDVLRICNNADRNDM